MGDALSNSANFSNQEIVNASELDAFFPRVGSDGNWVWGKSQDGLPAVMQRLLVEHDFVNAVRKSIGLPFEIVRDFNGVRVNGTSPLGEKFYAIMRIPLLKVPDNFSVCDHVRVFRDIQTTLGHADFQFTGNPSYVISLSGTCEGEVVNGFVQRLRETTKRKRFSEASKESSSLISNWNSGFKRYLQRQIESNPHLHCIRLELQTQPTNSDTNDAREAQDQIQAFFATVTSDLVTAVPGFWWKREFRSEIGFSHHAIILWDAYFMSDRHALLQELHKRWQSATKGNGQLFNLSPDPNNYRTWGLGSLWTCAEHLQRSVRLMLAREQYVRLSSSDSFAPVGMGKLPKAIKIGVINGPSTILSTWKSYI